MLGRDDQHEVVLHEIFISQIGLLDLSAHDAEIDLLLLQFVQDVSALDHLDRNLHVRVLFTE